MSKNTVAIVYNGGAYGTYLEWVLTTLTTDVGIVPPFNNNGNSHKFHGNHLVSINGYQWENFKNSKESVDFIRIHPKTPHNGHLDQTLAEILDHTGKVIYLYPDRQSVLLTINNFYKKIWKDWWKNRLLTDPTFVKNLKKNWKFNNLDQVYNAPDWVKREFLSFNLMPSWFSEVEWYYPDRQFSHPNYKLVLIKDLLYDFKEAILDIQKFCNLMFSKPVDEILPYHKTMLSLQQYATQDQLCLDIVSKTINNEIYNWEELPLPSEAWVQWELRNHGFEIRCNELDMFPTNSVHLKELLYPI